MTENTNTKLIPLTQGKFAIVDAEDYDWLMQYKWCYGKNGYAKKYLSYRKVNNKIICDYIMMHNFLMGKKQNMTVDHKNNNKLDNRKCNLRFATPSDNSRNQIKYKKNSTSKYKGVCWDKAKQKWSVKLSVNDKTINFGRFDNEEYAARVYDIWALYHFGDFAKTNRMLGLL